MYSFSNAGVDETKVCIVELAISLSCVKYFLCKSESLACEGVLSKRWSAKVESKM